MYRSGFDSTGQFTHLPVHDTARLAECLHERTIGLFLKLGHITQPFAQNRWCWRHSGFSVDNSVRFDRGDYKARQALAQYIARVSRSLQKLTHDRPGSGESPSQPAPAWTLTVPQRDCRSAWARLIAKVNEVDLR
jgi:hypothetical protein